VSSHLRRVRRLRGGDWRLLVEAIALAPYVELGLRVLPLNRLLARVGRARRLSRRAQDIDLDRTARIVEALFRRYPFRASCLKKSLVLVCLVRRRGLPAELRIGVTKAGDRLLAHAWVECTGRTLLSGDGVGQYHPLPPIMPAALAATTARTFPIENNI
jgi:hypothetical protein